VEDLLDSDHMEKIKSFCGKIKDDVSRWEAAGQLSLRLKDFYNEKAQQARDRVNGINQMIRERQPTLLERVGGFLRRLYRAIVERLPLFVRGFLTFKKRPMLDKAA
jgi:hypothetical protein